MSVNHVLSHAEHFEQVKARCRRLEAENQGLRSQVEALQRAMEGAAVPGPTQSVDHWDPREAAAALGVADCLTNKEIAERLRTTPQVVKNYLRSVYSKSGMSNRLELVGWITSHRVYESLQQRSAAYTAHRRGEG